MSKFIGIIEDNGNVMIHAQYPNGNYDTLCGIDANDSELGHNGVAEVSNNSKIDCHQCIQILELAWGYRRQNIIKR